MELVVVLGFEKFSGLSGFHWKLGLTTREKKIIFAVEYFRVIGLFVGRCGFPSGVSSFLYNMP